MFESAKLKVKRADQHIEELNRILADFVNSDFCRVEIEKDQDTGNHIVKFRQSKSMPPDVPLVIGDAIHNLRSALDLMACEIVSASGGTPTKWTQFPFRDTRQELVGTITGGEMKIAGADIISLIVDKIKPYKGGDDGLCALHSLDITDKHRLLIPVASVTALTNVNARFGGVTMTRCTFTVGGGGVINIASGGPDLQIEGHGTPAFGISFSEVEVFEGQPVVPTLHQLSKLVAGVIEAVEKAYLART